MSIYYLFIRPSIRKIFYLVGTFLLNALSYLFFWVRPKPIDVEKIHKILLIKMERMGDLILSTPAIRAIKRQCSNAHISIIINPYTKEIIENDLTLDEVMIYDSQKIHKSLNQKIGFIQELRARRFDLAIDLSTRDFLFKPVWLSYLSGAKFTLGLNNFGRGFLFNIKVKPYPKPRPLTEEILHILS